MKKGRKERKKEKSLFSPGWKSRCRAAHIWPDVLPCEGATGLARIEAGPQRGGGEWGALKRTHRDVPFHNELRTRRTSRYRHHLSLNPSPKSNPSSRAERQREQIPAGAGGWGGGGGCTDPIISDPPRLPCLDVPALRHAALGLSCWKGSGCTESGSEQSTEPPRQHRCPPSFGTGLCTSGARWEANEGTWNRWILHSLSLHGLAFVGEGRLEEETSDLQPRSEILGIGARRESAKSSGTRSLLKLSQLRGTLREVGGLRENSPHAPQFRAEGRQDQDPPP